MCIAGDPNKITVYLLYKIRDKPGVGGLMFWDCSWVQNNIVNGKDYGTHAFELLRGMAVTPTTTSTTSSHAPPKTTQTLPTKKTTTLTIPQTIKSPATTPIATAGE